MGDVLPPKRQTVVDRLRRRFELYRRHQNACLPRYEQAANGMYEAQKQETLLLKQRYLESKAKKVKSSKSDHHRSSYKESAAAVDSTKVHAKPVKRVAEESPSNSVPDTAADEPEKSAKTARLEAAPEKPVVSEPQQPSLPSFSVQIVQQFTNTSSAQHSQTIQTNVTVQPLPGSAPASDAQPTSQPATTPQEDTKRQAPEATADVECKQEKDSGQQDLCPCSNQNSSGGDRLSDTFPSLGFTDDSGDDVIHPDILKDLIDDVFTNSADIMKDFNFEDSVGSIKDPEDSTKDIIDLVKASSPSQLRAFQQDAITFVNNHANQQSHNGVFESSSADKSTSVTTTSASTFYNTASQRIPPPFGVTGVSLSGGLGLDFKLTEPSPAALTLKQMAEQHQSMQQQKQQLGNSSVPNHPFNQDTFSTHINPLRTSYMNGSASNTGSPKMTDPANIFGPFDAINSYPAIKAMSSDNVFKQEVHGGSTPDMLMPEAETQKLQRLQMMTSRQRTAQADCGQRPVGHFQAPVASQRQYQVRNQFQDYPEMRMQANHSQQMQQIPSSTADLKQQQGIIQSQANMYSGNYPQQSRSNTIFHTPMPQSLSYAAQFGSNPVTNRPPPEYKVHHSTMASNGLQMVERIDAGPHVAYGHQPKNAYVRHRKPPNLPQIAPDGSNAWGVMNHQSQVQMGSYTQPESCASVPRPHVYHQYRMPNNQVNLNRILNPGMTPGMMPQKVTMQHQQRNLSPEMSLPMRKQPLPPVETLGPMYNQDFNRQDGSHMSLDFLETIESTASDFLNFDQVMQSGGQHFQLLDDMEILGK